MIEFKYLNKSEKNTFLPLLFDIFYANMSEHLQSSKSYEQERDEWLSEVSAALGKEARKMIVCTDGESPVGFLMYYVREDMLMIEEVQLKEEFQRTRAFYLLCRHLMRALPENIMTVEAYAHKSNQNSQNLMLALGMECIGAIESLGIVHLRGLAEKIRAKLCR